MQNIDRITTTHAGSLPRPRALLDELKLREEGGAFDPGAFSTLLKASVADLVHKQLDAGVDVITDGEQSKLGFSHYIRERLGGYEERPIRQAAPAREEAEFPDFYEAYYAQLYKNRVLARGPRDVAPLACVAPVTYIGQQAVAADINNLKSALDGHEAGDAFLPATSPRSTGTNEYYATQEEYEVAYVDAIREEYKAILDAGLILQIDDPGCARLLSIDAAGVTPEQIARADRCIEIYDYALRDLPQDRIRLHVCYGVNAGPKVHDPNIREFAAAMLRVPVAAYSFEASNPRHFHEWRIWEDVKLPDDKALIPGVITHGSNNLEHPEFVAEQILNYASLVGRERVIAGADCGFSSQATYETEVVPSIIWAKLAALAEGARIASKRLWPN
jgi:5-methyltetrahydropteroyltriglutamate--homocysteine methyltransferase